MLEQIIYRIKDKKLHQFTHELKKKHMIQTEKSVQKETYGMD